MVVRCRPIFELTRLLPTKSCFSLSEMCQLNVTIVNNLPEAVSIKNVKIMACRENQPESSANRRNSVPSLISQDSVSDVMRNMSWDVEKKNNTILKASVTCRDQISPQNSKNLKEKDSKDVKSLNAGGAVIIYPGENALTLTGMVRKRAIRINLKNYRLSS